LWIRPTRTIVAGVTAFHALLFAHSADGQRDNLPIWQLQRSIHIFSKRVMRSGGRSKVGHDPRGFGLSLKGYLVSSFTLENEHEGNKE
jgi:hypothetical protein